MRKSSHRHPYVEAAVFGAALLLAAFIGRELWARRAPADPKEPVITTPIVLTPERLPLPGKPTTGRTETAVTGAPPIKLSRVQRRRPKSAPVPAPR